MIEPLFRSRFLRPVDATAIPHAVLVAFALLAATALGWGFPAAALAATVRTPQVEAELVREHEAAVPGAKAMVALRLKIAPGWHTYWQNPGDSGLPTTLKWKLPEGVTAGPIQWPYPSVHKVGPLVNYGYEGEVLHLVALSVPASQAPGTTLEVAARADWLVCRETCIPEGADLVLGVPVAAEPGAPTRWAEAIADARGRLPRPMPAGWKASAEGRGPSVALTIVPPEGVRPDASLHFFPFDEGRIEPAGVQAVRSEGGAVAMTLPVSSQLTPGFTRVAGVLVDPKGWGGAGRAIAIDVPLAGTVVAGQAPATQPPALDLSPSAGSSGAPGTVSGAVTASGASLSLVVALVSGFVGGMLLNLMPCVFPVLSLKLLSFATHGHHRQREVAAKGFAFAAGALATFWALAALLVLLKAAGHQLGWGFQLQSPPVIASLAILFFVLGLNLSGVFEVGQLVPGNLAAWQSRRPLLDAFGSGVLAVVVASPCTAPFMGAALGYALAQSSVATFGVFTALGLGMATPFTLLSLFPGWRRKLPRPGPWMAHLRQLLAFPLYATVIWLAWVLGVQLGVDAMVRLAVALLAVALGAWVLSGHRGRRGTAAWVFGVGALAGALAAVWPVFAGSPDAPVAREPAARSSAGADTAVRASRTAGAWEAWSSQRIAELNAAGKPVFVDFTAAWCVTCQVNKQLVLSRESVLSAFRERDVTLMRADWTRQDAAITRALQSLGRSGVPVYAFFRPGKPPVLLPEVLQESTIRDALAAL